jgi:hypothetical protein
VQFIALEQNPSKLLVSFEKWSSKTLHKGQLA